MTKAILWSSSAGDIPANLAFTNNFAATADPTASNDISQGYTPGSQWINQTDLKSFTMISNAAGAALWQLGGQPMAGETQQGAPAAVNTTATLTAANILAGIITSTTAAAVAATLPLATDMDLGFPAFEANDAFDFSVIATGANGVTMTTNTGWTLVGDMVVATLTSGRFRARKTAAGAWTLYRIS